MCVGVAAVSFERHEVLSCAKGSWTSDGVEGTPQMPRWFRRTEKSGEQTYRPSKAKEGGLIFIVFSYLIFRYSPEEETKLSVGTIRDTFWRVVSRIHSQPCRRHG